MTVGAGELDLGVRIKSVPWDRETEVASIAQFDVGIMPLHDGPFERGKCGYKLIQYMAVGRPVVGSPVGANCRIIQHGFNGFLANSVQEWTDAILQLYRDFRLRQRIGAEARKTVESKYCLQLTAPELASIFKQVVDKHKQPADSSLRYQIATESSGNTGLVPK